MTRNQIVTEAARRLGDTATDFVAVLDNLFSFVLGKMAQAGAVTALNAEVTFLLTVNTRDYNTRTAAGMAAPDFPYDVLRLRVRAWGEPDGVLERRAADALDAQRQLDGDAARGRPKMWALDPDETNIRMHPPASATEAGAVVDMKFLNKPTIVASATEIDEIRAEDLDVIVAGIMLFGADFLEETRAEEVARGQKAQAQWETGLAIMAARARDRLRNPRRRLAEQQRLAGSR